MPPRGARDLESNERDRGTYSGVGWIEARYSIHYGSEAKYLATQITDFLASSSRTERERGKERDGPGPVLAPKGTKHRDSHDQKWKDEFPWLILAS